MTVGGLYKTLSGQNSFMGHVSDGKTKYLLSEKGKSIALKTEEG